MEGNLGSGWQKLGFDKGFRKANLSKNWVQ